MGHPLAKTQVDDPFFYCAHSKLIDMEPDSLTGVLEIHDLDIIANPIRDSLFSTEYIGRALMLGGAILAGIVLLWVIDRILTWAVNHSVTTERRSNKLPFFLFPAFFFAAFIIDYITIIFGTYELPYLSFAVLAVKGSYFLSTAFWAMKEFNVPLGTLISFTASIFKAWKTKDVDDLNRSIENLSGSDRKSGGIGKKTTIMILLLFVLSCLSPRRAEKQVIPVPASTISVMDTLKIDTTVKVYRSAFDADYLIKKANEKRKTKRVSVPVKIDTAKVDSVKADVIDTIELIEDSVNVNHKHPTDSLYSSEDTTAKSGIPIIYKGKKIGVLKVK